MIDPMLCTEPRRQNSELSIAPSLCFAAARGSLASSHHARDELNIPPARSQKEREVRSRTWCRYVPSLMGSGV